MASIVRVYWQGWRRRKGWLAAAMVLAAGSLVGSPGSAPAWAAAPRLLVLRDALTAGDGLPHADGFEMQLQRALQARGRAPRR
jgi:hypothetical protein